MSIKAFDTADITTGHAHEILAHGFEAVGIYLRDDRAPLTMIQGLHSVGIKIFSIWEKGNPTEPSYFTAAKGFADAQDAVAYAKAIGQPTGTTISPCVDYDSNPEDVKAYLIAFHDEVKAADYLSLPYGNGVTLSWAIDAGYAYGGYLSQSTGFTGYESFLERAAIMQGPGTTILDFDVDLDEVVDAAVLW